MRQGLNWYKRDPHAFLDGVQGLGPDLIGAYSVLLDLFYARGGESPRDDRHLAGILGCSVRKARALTDALIERGKITFHDGFITNSRAKRDARIRRDESETRSTAQRERREKERTANENNDLQDKSVTVKPPREEESREDNTEGAACPKPDPFDDWWDVYPLKKDKKKALEKFRAALKRASLDELMRGARNYAEHCRANHTENTYIKHAKTWLGNDSWEDWQGQSQEVPAELRGFEHLLGPQPPRGPGAH